MPRRYWGYRIDTSNLNYFRSELEKGILRQGWGSHQGQNLRNLSLDGGARRNFTIFKKVKKGDILLVPRLPNWSQVAIVEATDDFCNGYVFEISQDMRDYGHQFPVKYIKQFSRTNSNVSGRIRATIKNVSRFWNIDHCADEIEFLLAAEDSSLRSKQSYIDRFSNTVNDSFYECFDQNKFSKILYDRFTTGFSNEEWEYALVEGLKKIFPPPNIIERTGGVKEAEHGTDITIRIPGLMNYDYLIAIQVKDYEGYVNGSPLKQLSKADSYWSNENTKLIDKILIITKSEKHQNKSIASNDKGINIVFANELEELLSQIGKSYLGLAQR